MSFFGWTDEDLHEALRSAQQEYSRAAGPAQQAPALDRICAYAKEIARRAALSDPAKLCTD